MRRIDWIGRIAGVCTRERMVPLSCHRRSSRDSDYSSRYRLMIRVNSTVTNQIVGGDIRDRLLKMS